MEVQALAVKLGTKLNEKELAAAVRRRRLGVHTVVYLRHSD